MIVSLNWLKKFTDIDMPIDELATLIGARLVEIEDVIKIGDKYKDVLIVKVISADKLEGSDHLSVTKIYDGGVINGLDRDENGYIQVVCGAPNIRAGLLVAWLPPESVVPETYDKPEPFKLGIRNLRGTVSNGMIASGRELALSDDHEGILELEIDAVPGTPLTKAFELDDCLLDIENKSLTHRPDCFGIVGFAREVAAISGKPFKTPDWMMNLSTDFGVDIGEANLNAFIDDANLCPRYTAIVLSDADGSRKSPMLIQTYLSRVGVRSINAVVDVTNYLMMLTGQPLHAFDYDKLVSLNGGKAEIYVRSGREKEELELLDGRKIELTPDDIVIASGETAIGLAGAMGGANTAIDSNTKRIIIESATFNLYKLRATQMRHGIFSEAITRFTKGQPAELTVPVLREAVNLIGKWSGGKPVSQVIDIFPGKLEMPEIEIPIELINATLGAKISTEQVKNILENVEFSVNIQNDIIRAKAPYWRSDIHIFEDIIEEVGRLGGFDNITPTLPMRSFEAITPSAFDEFRTKLREILVRAGNNEVLSYSFIHGNVLKKSGQLIENSYRIVNSISPELQYYRQTLTPSLLGLINTNIRQGYDSFGLFEINKTHQKSNGLNEEKVPVESNMLALVIANKNQQNSAQFYQAKYILEFLSKSLGVKLGYLPQDADASDALSVPFEYRRSALVVDELTGLKIGAVGEYKKSVISNFKLPLSVAGFEIDISALFDIAMKVSSSYRPASRFPASERDICFQIVNDVTYRKIIIAAEEAIKASSLEVTISPVDIYQQESSVTKNITIHIKIISHDHTLTSEEVASVIDNISNSVVSATKATVI